MNTKILSQTGRHTFLIAGKHGSLVDTIMLAQANESTGTISLVSIPRDLFFNGRKINSFYMHYGLKEFVRKLEELTGLKIEAYALVDMYAFIDLVDQLGGIDIHLDQAVIDPTYKTVDDGVEGTMYFAEGDHHLNGVQALRLARSRHTSSDFARSARQQKIIRSLQNRIKEVGVSNPSLLANLIKIALSKLETNVSLQDALSYYLKYKDFGIAEKAVLSTANILEYNYQVVGIDEEIFDKECQTKIAQLREAGVYQAGSKLPTACSYVLLPKDNDWDAFRSYLRGRF
ncbi:MAG: LCP family protein [Candidatus Gracilibacteria bacterium]|nr:LCP family protein [Candidatus Gracilibacteria bacterium]